MSRPSGAGRAYRVLLLLFPRDFRREFGEEMTRLFLERRAEVEGGAVRTALSAAAVLDVVGHTAAEWTARVWRFLDDVRREGTTIVAYAVSRRVHEIGIRRALGASSSEVIGLVIRQGIAPALVGVVVGLTVSRLGATALAALLYEVEPQDPATLASVTLLFLAVVLGATALPARHAAGIQSGDALREE